MYKGKIIQKMFKKDIGKQIKYINIFGIETLIIKNFDNKKQTAWIVYNYNNDGNNYMNYTGTATKYSDLEF